MNNKLILIFALMLTACHEKSDEAEKEKTSALSEKEQIERGAYLVNVVAGCNDCHSAKKMTPQGPVPDEVTLLAGHLQDEKLPPTDGATPGWVLFNMNTTAFVGPWGVSFAANLTPHETGIGTWDYNQFETAIRTGKYKGLKTGRTLLPPMPWMSYKDMKDEDLRAIFAYLKSIPPVNNLVPSQLPPQGSLDNKH